MAKGVSITYGDVAPEAKENFKPTASERKFDTIGNLQRYNMPLYNYANPCELYQTVLDGAAVALPSDPAIANIGLWSEQLSDDDGNFTMPTPSMYWADSTDSVVDKDVIETPITLTLESEGQYSSQGFTFTFDKFNQIYPTRLTIQWFRVTNEGIEDLSDGAVEFNPTSAFYFCRKQVENFNKVVIKFYSLNMPKNRLKVEIIDYGYGTVFYGDELRNVKIAQYLDPISTQIKINTCNFVIDSKSDMEYSFQAKQPLSVRFNDKLLTTVFVKSSKRTAKFLWEVTAEDYIGVMSSKPYGGGMYEDISVGDILEDIFTVAKVPYSVENSIKDVKLSGYIPYTTCREALMQVCFAAMAVVNTANSDVVEIKTLDNDVKQRIPLSRIKLGQNFDSTDTVTEVVLTVHSYSKLTETVEAYKADDSGTGENILVKFSEPLHDLTIRNGTIIKSNVNYAYINANAGCVLSGQGYEHTEVEKPKRNPKVLASEQDNPTSITSATLVTMANYTNILDHCYEWLTRTDSVNLSIVEGKHVTYGKPVKWGESTWGSFLWGGNSPDIVTYDEPVALGDLLETETEYLGTLSGRLIQQSYDLNSGIIVKEAVLK